MASVDYSELEFRVITLFNEQKCTIRMHKIAVRQHFGVETMINVTTALKSKVAKPIELAINFSTDRKVKRIKDPNIEN